MSEFYGDGGGGGGGGEGGGEDDGVRVKTTWCLPESDVFSFLYLPSVPHTTTTHASFHHPHNTPAVPPILNPNLHRISSNLLYKPRNNETSHHLIAKLVKHPSTLFHKPKSTPTAYLDANPHSTTHFPAQTPSRKILIRSSPTILSLLHSIYIVAP